MRAKRFTRTVAFRITEEEWEIIQGVIDWSIKVRAENPNEIGVSSTPLTPSWVIRSWIQDGLDDARKAQAHAKGNANNNAD